MIKAIVTDIEGTTTSLSFVKDVLFPYARTHLADFIRSHAHESEVETLLAGTCEIVGEKLDTEQIISQLIKWIDEDKKVTPLKSLQGLIWEAGYQQSDFKGHIYPDAAEQLKKWHEHGFALYVYSSGSVHAQKLLFSHTEYGDLTPLFSGYFDTYIGGKKEVSSYQRIAENIALQGKQILFLSDIVEELDAAQAAGFATTQLIRVGSIDKQANHAQVNDFAEIELRSLF